MEYVEFRRHIGKANLTINEFAGYLDVRPSSVSNHARNGRVPPAYAVLAVLMGDAADHGVDFRAVLARFGIRSIRARGNVRSLHAVRSMRAASSKSEVS